MTSKILCTATLGLVTVLAAPTCQEAGETSHVDDPSPRARLRLSGFMEGRLEPCGCASGQLGGLPRRAFYVRRDRQYDLLIEGGNLVASATPLDVAKLETALNVLSIPDMTYHALGIGAADLQLPLQELSTYLEFFPGAALSSDVVPPEGAAWPIVPAREYQAGEARVRVASLSLGLPGGEAGEEFELLPPDRAWARAMDGIDPETLRVLLVHGAPEVARAQSALSPSPDLIIGVTDLVAEPLGEPEPAAGVPVVFTGTRGRMVIDLTLARINGAPQVTRYEVERLSGSQTSKGAMEDEMAKQIVLGHREMVKAMGIREQMANTLPTADGATYVGSESCESCHESAYAAWENSKHANAWETLEKAERGDRYGWPVTHYPDCVTCHVVGYRYQSGFVNPEETPELKDVGCEQCHGPGSKHVEDDTVKMTTRGVDSCIECHDFEQSPGFAESYQQRWKEIEHYLDK